MLTNSSISAFYQSQVSAKIALTSLMHIIIAIERIFSMHSTVCDKYTHTSSYRKVWILKECNQAAAQCNLESTSNQSLYCWTRDLPSSSLYCSKPASSLYIAGNMKYFNAQPAVPFQPAQSSFPEWSSRGLGFGPQDRWKWLPSLSLPLLLYLFPACSYMIRRG